MRSRFALAALSALASALLVAEVVAATNDTDDDTSDAVDGAPVVEFVGGAPKVKIYPAGSSVGGSTWIMLTFGKIQELTASGAKVTEHSIMSLASASGIIWTQEDRDMGGTTAMVTRTELPLAYGGSFKECAGSGGGTTSGTHGNGNGGNGNNGGTLRRLQTVGNIAIEVFLFTEAATIQYGTDTIEVAAGQMKFNIESETWPFCAADNKLEVNMDIKTPNGGSGGSMSSIGDARGPPSNRFTASAGGRDVIMDLPTMTLVDSVLSKCDVVLDMTGGKMNLAFTFPAFTSSVVYDPLVGFASDSTTGDDSSTTGDGASTSSSDESTTQNDGTTSTSDSGDSTTEEETTTSSVDDDASTSSSVHGDSSSTSEDEEDPANSNEMDSNSTTSEAEDGGDMPKATPKPEPTGAAKATAWSTLGSLALVFMPILAM